MSTAFSPRAQALLCPSYLGWLAPICEYRPPCVIERSYGEDACYFITAGEPDFQLARCAIVDDFGNLVEYEPC